MFQAGSPRPVTLEGDFDRRSLLVGYVVDKEALGYVFLPIISQLHHTHPFVSFFHGTAVPSGPRRIKDP
jgi:hypothetical protein